MSDENFVKIQYSPELLLAFEEHGKKGESLGDFMACLVLHYLEEKKR